MKLLVVVLCLLSERFLIHSISYRRFIWFGDYCQRIIQLIEKNYYYTNPWLILLSIIIPIILITTCIYGLLQGFLFGFGGLIFSIFLFFYCLGPKNAFYPVSDTNSETSNTETVGNYFAIVNSQLFSVIFWYVISGPIAALTYRLITLCRDVSTINQVSNEVSDLLEWIPARITVLLFLIVGNFQRGFNLFTQFIASKPDLNNAMLRECGLQAVRSRDTDEVPMPVAETLVEHAAIVLLVFIALFTLLAWL